MSVLRFNAFGGEVPKLSNRLLPANGAQIAKDCALQSGKIVPLNNPVTVNQPTKPGTKRTIYNWGGAPADNIVGGKVSNVSFDVMGSLIAPRFLSQTTPSDTQDWEYPARTSISDNGSVMAIGAPWAIDGVNAQAGAVYAYDVIAGVPTREQRLPRSVSNATAALGGMTWVSGDGSTIAGGARLDDGPLGADTDAGCVFVWIRSAGGRWVEEVYLRPDTPVNGSRFGWQGVLSEDGNTLAVSAPTEDYGATTGVGAVYIFRRTAGVWVQSQRIASPTIVLNYWFGINLSLSSDGTRLFVGRRDDESVGQVEVYVESSGSFPATPTQSLTASDGVVNDRFGAAHGGPWLWPGKSIHSNYDGSVVAIGAFQWEGGAGTDRGAVYIFRLSGTYSQDQIVTATSNDTDSKWYGWNVHLDNAGEILAVGAQSHSISLAYAGAAYLYDGSGASFTEHAVMEAPTPVTLNYWGYEVVISGNGGLMLVTDTADTDNGNSHTMIYAIQDGQVTVTSELPHELTTAYEVFMDDILGTTQLNGSLYAVTVLSPTSFRIDDVLYPLSAYESGGVFSYMTGFWFHWTDDVDVIRGPIAGDTSERTYFTGDGVPKVTYSPIATSGGGTNYPNNTYDLGIPAPTSQPICTPGTNTGTMINATQTDPVVVESTAHGRSTGDTLLIGAVTPVVGMTELNGNEYTITVVDDDNFELNDTDGTAFGVYASGGDWEQTYDISLLESRSYVYTLVSAIGEEGPPSPASTIRDLGFDQEATITGLASPPAGNYNWGTGAKKRIYRSNAGEFQFLVELDIATSSYVDTADTADLGEIIPSTYWDAPPADMQGLTLMANGIAVGFSGNEICFSEPYILHAWPPLYRQTIGYDVVAIKAIGQSVVIATTGKPTLITGVDPAAMSAELIELQQACASKRSMVDMGEYACYASPDGLVAIGAGIRKLVSYNEISEKYWKGLNPESIDGYFHEQAYIGFYDNGSEQGGFIYKLADQDSRFTRISDFATAGYNALQEDTLYLQIGDYIKAWNKSDSSRTYQWKSKVFENALPMNFSAGIVYASNYPVTLNVYYNGELYTSKRVLKDDIFRLKDGVLAKNCEIEIVGEYEIHSLILAESPDELLKALDTQ